MNEYKKISAEEIIKGLTELKKNVIEEMNLNPELRLFFIKSAFELMKFALDEKTPIKKIKRKKPKI